MSTVKRLILLFSLLSTYQVFANSHDKEELPNKNDISFEWNYVSENTWPEEPTPSQLKMEMACFSLNIKAFLKQTTLDGFYLKSYLRDMFWFSEPSLITREDLRNGGFFSINFILRNQATGEVYFGKAHLNGKFKRTRVLPDQVTTTQSCALTSVTLSDSKGIDVSYKKGDLFQR